MSAHDPLLPPPPPPARKPEPTRRTRRPSPAASARILATGLATTAMLGLTTGYAFAKKAQQVDNTPNVNQTHGGTTPDNTVPAPNTANPIDPTTSTVAPTPDADSQQSVVTSPPVVVIPVPESKPAQPGNNWNGGNNQPSNGSR